MCRQHENDKSAIGEGSWPLKIWFLWYPIFKFGHIASMTRLFFLDTYSECEYWTKYRKDNPGTEKVPDTRIEDTNAPKI